MDPAPLWTDIKTFPCEAFRDRVDLLVAGYPCQPFSAAGKRLGTEDPRHLWPHIARAIGIIRPRMCFFENVEGHISLGLREVIGELESIGYTAAWGIFSASEVGAPHQRKRVFILAVSNSLGGAAGVSRSLAWNEGIAGEFDHGGGEGGSRLENSNDRGDGHWGAHGLGGFEAGPQSLQQERQGDGHRSKSSDGHCAADGISELANAGRIEPQGWCGAADGQQSGAGRIPRGEPAPRHDQVWPSRPGEPQHAWEPPRVVGNATQRNVSREQGCRVDTRTKADAQRATNNDITDGPSADCAESMGNAHSPRPQERTGQRGAGIQGTHADGGADAERQIEPSVGRDSDGPARGMDYAELCISCDNRTDELRLLGNGVVPATAERAFRTLWEELSK